MGGIYTTSKEANMYPKPIQDLSGWNVRSIACSTKGWTAACDDAVISCQPSPCYGELGNGDKKKSSAAPCIVDTLDGLYILKVGAGPAHTLLWRAWERRFWQSCPSSTRPTWRTNSSQ